ncbi:uncharacterized protein LOC133285964 [Gastrolobium bilobum]|uniref:uncharacterized protein LOC133285964 n=1 Tax=Gastrolobium bilobum TaxID=150636 RepID=UPI002AAFD8B9|nr:uncharacterized protein LOC133285964 [Gastrolobium bilobum]
MFTSDEWSKSKTAKDPKGKRATDIVLSTSFWNDVVFCLKAMGPLVGVLRMVDNEKMPAMGYIYETMDKAKEAIQNAFHGIGKEDKLDDDLEVVNGYLKCFERITANTDEMDQVMNELELYKKAWGLFGMDSAKRQRDKVSPPLQYVSAIEIHSKRRSRLEHQKLEDLVYIKYNKTLKYRFDNRDLIDPILLNGIDESNEWLVGDMGGDGEQNENELQTKSIALPSSSKGKEIKEKEGLKDVPEQLYNIDTSDSEAEADFGDGRIQDYD